MTETWNSARADEMASIVSRSGIPLDEDDRRLVERYIDPEAMASVYDLHRLNVLCHQVIGFRVGLRDGVELAREHAMSTCEYIGSGDWVEGPVDFTEVDVELERRLSHG